MLAAITAFAVFSPLYYNDRLYNEAYSEWLKGKRERDSQIINVWHVVDFKPYSGSLGGWIEKRARKYFSDHSGVYYEVCSVSPEEAESMLERGMKPDVVSFAWGRFPASFFTPAEANDTEKPFALPYCASCRVLVYDPTAFTDKDALISEAGTSEQFKAGKADSCVCDLRGAGDLWRASIMGKCRPFEVKPLDEQTELIQYLGIHSEVSEAKLTYAQGFIEYLLNEDSQKSIAELGLLPIRKVDVRFEPGWIGAIYKSFDPDKLPDRFV